MGHSFLEVRVLVIQKEEAIQVRSKKLKLAVATVPDSPASIPLDILEEHIVTDCCDIVP